MSVAVNCQTCGQGAPLILRSDDPDFDAKVQQWREDHQREHHAPPLGLLLVVGIAMFLGWVLA